MKIVQFLLLASVLVLFGCSSHRTCYPDDWAIMVGSGGGITGGSSGYTIDHNGKISSWRILQPGKEKEVADLFEVGCDSAAFFRTYLGYIGFDTMKYSEVGNWTSFVELRHGELANRVNWTGEKGAAQVRNFYDLFVGFVTSRGKK